MTVRGRKILKGLGRLVCVAVSLAVLWNVFRRLELPAFGRVLGTARPGWLLAAMVCFGIALLLMAARWHLVLRLGGLAVHPGATFRTAFIGHLFNTLLFGAAPGDVAKSALYARWYRHPTPSVVGSCVLDRLLGGGGYLLFALLTGSLLVGGWVLSQLNWRMHSDTFMWLAAGILALAGAGGLLWVRWDLRPLFRQAFGVCHSSGRQLLARPRLSARVLLLAFCAHVFGSGVLFCCLKAVVHKQVPLPELLWTFPVISLIGMVPIAYAGVGLREAGALFFLAFTG